MNSSVSTLLAPLPYLDWAETKTTLQLFAQIVGKIQMRYTRLRNHWWNVTLRPTARGLATHPMREGDTFFDIEFDFVDHRLALRSNRSHEALMISLRDGLSVAEFYMLITTMLQAIGLEASIIAKPYGQEAPVAFAQDTEHHRYDATQVRRWWDALLWSSDVMNEFGTSFLGKQSEPQLFWHSFDLAVGRFNGRKAARPEPENRVMREAYSSEVIAFGFWAGDVNIPAPTYYTYTAPEPKTLTTFSLSPSEAKWVASGAGHLGTLSYDVVRESGDPRTALLTFFNSGFEAGTSLAGWDTTALTRATDGTL